MIESAEARSPTDAARPTAAAQAMSFVPILVGTVAALALVAATPSLVSQPEREILGSWLPRATWPGRELFALLRSSPASHSGLVVALFTLIASWLSVVILVSKGRLSGSRSLIGLAVWLAPFAFAPPLLSRDVFAYAAQGELMRQGLDPYRRPAAALGSHSTVLSAVDPLWRHSLTPYGPLTLRVQEAAVAVAGGSERLVLVAFRILALCAVLLTALMLRRGVPPLQRELRTWLLFSPLVLVHLVGGMHVEVLMCPLLVLCVVLVRRGHAGLAGAAAGLAFDIKATAAFMLIALAVHAGARRGRAAVASVVGGAVLAVLASVPLMAGDPFGWTRALRTTAQIHAPAAPSTTAYQLMADALARAHASVPGVLLSATHAAVAGGGLLLAAGVLWTGRGRPLPWLMVAVSLLGLLTSPILWPWYLGPTAAVLLTDRSSLLRAALLGSLPVLLAVPIQAEASQRLALVGWLLGACSWLRWHARSDSSAGLVGAPDGAVARA